MFSPLTTLKIKSMKPTENKTLSILRQNSTFLAITLLFFVIWSLNIPITKTLWRHSFDDGTYSHAYLIPFIVLYLYYSLASIKLLEFSSNIKLAKVILLAISCFCLFITATAQLSVGYWLSILLVCLASVNLLFRFNWYLLFPTTLLIFIFPVWGALVPLLQNISTKAVTFIMGFSGIPIYVEGQFITIPAGVFEIAGGCSGLRYLIVSLAISSLFIFLYIQNVKRACLFLTVAILGALLTNWIRITALIVIGDYTDMQSSLMTDHNAFGWYLYMPFMLLLFLWGNRLSDHDLVNTKHSAQTEVSDSAQHYGNVWVLLLCLTISSTTINASFSANETPDIANEFTGKIKPSVHFYSAVEQNKNTGNNIKLTYYFNGNELDGKPSYYENNLIPNGWKVIDQQHQPKGLVYSVSRANKEALIVANYEINQQKFSSLSAFKMARLTLAAKNISKTKLNWLFIPCTTSCDDELNALKHHSNDL